MLFFHVTIVLHCISLFLCLPFAYVQFRLRNLILLALLIPVSMIHALLLAGFFTWGDHVTGLSPWGCALRKGVYVYAAQGAQLMSAMVIVRLWMSTFGYLPSAGPQVEQFERQTVAVGLALAFVPGLIASMPQIIADDYVSDMSRLNKCSSGYIKAWQVIASGAAFSIPTVGASLLALGAISWRLGFLICYREQLVSKVHSRNALRHALWTLLRVLLFFVSIGTTQIYYIAADFLVIYKPSGTALGESTRSRHGNRFGHLMLSMWGIIMFLIFNTSRQSLWVLRASCGKGRLRSHVHSALHEDQVYAGMPASASTTTSEANLVHQSRGPAGTYASSATHDTRLSGSATTTKQQAATAMPMTTTAAIVPPRPTLLPTPGVPTLARCQRDRIMNMRGNSLDRPVAEAYGIARRPCAGEMRTVAPPSPVFARRISATKQNEQPCPHPPMTDNARTTYYNNNDGNDRGQWSKPFYDGPTFI